MVRGLPLFIITGLMVGCASAPEADEVPVAPKVLHMSCYQAGWQAETVPIIYTRGGQEALDKYDAAPRGTETGCR
ncbi:MULTISPECIES: hypothetical protein [unclassified Pseudomonas]|uniref:hypothetical protein n=1 Tax=unclassified Pseudomonas TaxID=196821 RepID=UPI002AC956F0|nr:MULTISPECIES: hypothetical protein [unclassified Pseudomonas]MEB0040340.1 hypothetical protein [Pseudomonas sp. MH10]MEB0077373.1 hypothetical protein [Pseudomonas sp. MH10out]MEB0092845.1 hypothetical protein [Pseudomonas sp. CCI4.2]MEB0101172.1 hypothetical protein [Pseudomonas sp. CCI3.2]MEB0120551.1 hypothetical protein [Pseudomonas sp. CCI1.2]